MVTAISIILGGIRALEPERKDHPTTPPPAKCTNAGCRGFSRSLRAHASPKIVTHVALYTHPRLTRSKMVATSCRNGKIQRNKVD
jgi:hypothetical protein